MQQAWVDNDVPQCGYCQSGMIMAVAALLKHKPKPTDADIDEAITNICRCGTFQQVRAAIHAAAQRVREEHTMNYVPKINRRSFVVGTAAVGGGLALGLDFRPARQKSSAPRTARRKSTSGS